MTSARRDPRILRFPQDREEIQNDEVLPLRPALAFAPVYKTMFGIAVGTACAVFVLAFTVFHLLLSREQQIAPLLLAQYFYGYTASARGLIVGPAWGFAVGFVMGWFVAFCRNMVIAVSVFMLRTRAELAQTREFLDHI
jgi:hypothetical protein